MKVFGFTPQERRAVQNISLLFALRIVGLFLLYPVLAFYAESLTGQTLMLIGWAFGIYGLAQAGLQIPFGMLSDRFGRRPMIAIGLGLFIVGSLIAAYSDHIFGLILGRFFQGAGAISSVCTATLGDVVDPTRRAKAMAFLGISIGAAFSISLIAGPYLADKIGVSGIFFMLAGLGLMALLVLYWGVPKVQALGAQDSMQGLAKIFADKACLQVALSIGILHAILTAMFLVVPGQLFELTGTTLASHGTYYLIGVLLVFLTVFPMLSVIEKKQWHHQAFVAAVLTLLCSQWLMWLRAQDVYGFFAGLILFFLAFNLLEASLPAWMTRIANPAHRGAAMGVYSTFQFLGTFLGGVLGGTLLQYSSVPTLYFVQGCIILLWLGLYRITRTFNLKGERYGQQRR